jgi:hypothetical protein
MDKKELEEQIINNYKQDETMMVLVFAQWCVNNDLDPATVYKKAYPGEKGENEALRHAISLTVPKEESEYISPETLLGVLSLFGNDDLAFVVTEEMDMLKKRKNDE